MPHARSLRPRTPYSNILLALTALAFGLPAGAAAQFVVGAQGGLGAFTVAGEAPAGASYGRKGRLVGSAVLGYRFGSSVLLRVEPGLIRKGAGVAYEVDGIEEPVDSLALSLDYVSVPVVVQVFTPGGRGFVTAGLELGILGSATLATVDGGTELDVKDRLESQDLALLFGVGGLVRRSAPQVALEIRYDQSLTKAFEGDSGASGLPRALRSSGLALIAGISWTLGGDR